MPPWVMARSRCKVDRFLDGNGIAKACIRIFASILDREAHKGHQITRHPYPVAKVFVGAIKRILIFDDIVRKIGNGNDDLLAAILQLMPTLQWKRPLYELSEAAAFTKCLSALYKLEDDTPVIETCFEVVTIFTDHKRAITENIALLTCSVCCLQIIPCIYRNKRDQ